MNRTLCVVLSRILPVKSWRKKFRAQIANSHTAELGALGEGTVIRRSAHLDNAPNIFVGSTCYIGENVRLVAMANIKIGDNVTIGEDTIVYTSNHDYRSPDTFPYSLDTIAQDVEFERDNWVGARSIILPGCKIGAGAVVGAGSVVTKSVPSCAIIGGNPARIIGWRDKETYLKNAPNNKFRLGGNDVVTFLDGYKPELIEKKK